jgi:hypothetical protein
MSSFNVILNSNNVKINNGYANQLIFEFINGSFTIKPNMKIQLVSAQIPYSFFNISNFYNNQKFNILWPRGSLMINYNVIIPNGFYSVSDINKYIKFFCDLNNLFLIDGGGNRVYYINFSNNSTYYSNQLNLYTIPSSLPSGYSSPLNWTFPNVAKTPQIEILDNNFVIYSGFDVGLYPSTPQSINYEILSQRVPKSSNVNSIFISSNISDNEVSVPSNILDIIPIYGSFGGNIHYESKLNKKISLKQGTYNNIIFNLLDDDLNLLPILDPNIILNFLITTE